MTDILNAYLIIGFIFSLRLVVEWYEIYSYLSKHCYARRFTTVFLFLYMNLFMWPYMLYLEFKDWGGGSHQMRVKVSTSKLSESGIV